MQWYCKVQYREFELNFEWKKLQKWSHVVTFCEHWNIWPIIWAKHIKRQNWLVVTLSAVWLPSSDDVSWPGTGCLQGRDQWPAISDGFWHVIYTSMIPEKHICHISVKSWYSVVWRHHATQAAAARELVPPRRAERGRAATCQGPEKKVV